MMVEASRSGCVKPYPDRRHSGATWLPSVPAHWAVLRLRFVADERNERNGIQPRGEMLSVSGYRGIEIRRYESDDSKRTSEELADYRVVYPQDLVVNTMWLNYTGLGVSKFQGYVSPAYRVFKLRPRLFPGFVHHLMRSAPYVGRYTALLQGIRPNSLQVTADDFRSLEVIIPPLAEQHAIASFLDRETSRIDALIAKKERLVELLEEKRTALISQAVTKGLDLGVPTRDSGLPWLGVIPQHWMRDQLRRVVRPGTIITYGIVQAGPDVEGGVPYIRTSDMGGSAFPRDGYLRTTPEIDLSYRRSKVEQGDLVIAIRASIGKVLPVPNHLHGANLTQGTARISPGPAVHGPFLMYALRSNSSQQRFQALAKGATFREITLEMVRRFEVALPPLEEQQRIADHLNHLDSRFDFLIDRIQLLVSRLREYRTALITAAVMGQIDVRRGGDDAG